MGFGWHRGGGGGIVPVRFTLLEDTIIINGAPPGTQRIVIQNAIEDPDDNTTYTIVPYTGSGQIISEFPAGVSEWRVGALSYSSDIAEFELVTALDFAASNASATSATTAWVQPTDVHISYAVLRVGDVQGLQNIWNRNAARWAIEIEPTLVRHRARNDADGAMIRAGSIALAEGMHLSIVGEFRNTDQVGRIWANGALLADTAQTFSGYHDTSQGVTIGSTNGAAGPFNGVLYSVGFLNGNTGANVAAALVDELALPSDFTSLTNQWRFDEGMGASQDNTVGVGEALTLANTEWVNVTNPFT